MKRFFARSLAAYCIGLSACTSMMESPDGGDASPVDAGAVLPDARDAGGQLDVGTQDAADAGFDVPPTCPADTACVTYSAVNGACVPTLLSGVNCDDGRACTSSSICMAGVCTGAAVSCEHGGTCAPSGDCACPAGWTGPACATDVDECLTGYCGAGSTCTNTQGGATCACLTRFTSPTNDGKNCVNTTGKAIELVVFYDESVERIWGDQTRERVEAMVLHAKGLYERNFASLPITIGLEAQIRLGPLPAAIRVRACDTTTVDQPSCAGCWTNPTPPSCASPLSLSANETDAGLLLSSFSTFVQMRRAALTASIGSFDHAVLLSTHDLPASIIELAASNAMCGASSYSVMEIRADQSVAFNGVVLAHALGHSLSMQHDAPGSPTVMAPSAMESVNVFSAASETSYRNYAMGSFGQCLNDGAQHAWRTTRCGDGTVSPGEACDPGGAADTCCTATCQLAPGCQCANSRPCCANGAPRAAQTVCRASTGACDLADVCDGSSGECPLDHYASPGTSCNGGGTCLRNVCVPTRSELCVQISSGQSEGVCASMPGGCGSDGLQCQFGASCAFFPNAAIEGLSCGAGSQCLMGTCRASSALKEYRWRVGAFGACAGATQTRTVACEDETGATVGDGLCTTARPSESRACM